MNRKRGDVSEANEPALQWRERTFSDDPASLERIPGWDIHCLQVSRGQLGGHSFDLHLPGVQLLFEDYRHVATSQHGCGPPDSISFGIALGMEREGLLNGMCWADGLSAFDTRCEIDAIVAPTRLISVVVERRLLQDYLRDTERVDIEDGFAGSPVVVNQASLAAGLSRSLRRGVAGVDWGHAAITPVAFGNRLQQGLLELLAPIVVEHLRPTRAERHELAQVEVVRRARDYLSQHREEPPSIGDLCRVLGVSRRWLQRSFNEVLQMGPSAYLRAMRLSGARRLLSDGRPGRQVKDAVESFGFWHLSRFSRDYRALFGELPSETLKRTRQSTRPSTLFPLGGALKGSQQYDVA